MEMSIIDRFGVPTLHFSMNNLIHVRDIS